MASSSPAANKAKEEMEAARVQVMDCEKEIQSVKTALRQLGTADQDEPPNSLEFAAIKTTGFPLGAQPSFSLQLSSPVEEKTLVGILDDDDVQEGTRSVFEQVETSVATLVVTAKDMDIPMGTSDTYDVATLCPLDAMKPQTEYVTEHTVEFFADEGKEETDKKAEEEAEEKQHDEKDKDSNDDNDTEQKKSPVCTVTLRVTYKPSVKDKREELYELLNKASQRKAQAIDRLRKSATAVSRAGPSSSTAIRSSSSNPAVKSGFLNKSKPKNHNKALELYDKFLGPDSFLRRFVPAAKDYIIFFGTVAFLHFKGQMLALPPPV